MGSPDGSPARPRPRAAPWLARLSGSLGAFTAGMAGNLVSADIGYRGVAVAAAVATILVAAVWLRGFRPDFGLVVWVVRGFLLIAVAAVVAATMVGAALSGVMVLVAALATLGAAVIRTDPADRLGLLGAVALLGYGVATMAYAISATHLTGTGRFWMITLGALGTLYGLGAMGQSRLFVDFVTILVDVALTDVVPLFHMLAAALVFFGVLAAANGAVLPAVGLFVVAIGASAMRIGHIRRVPGLVGLGAMAVGVVGAAVGIWAIVDGEPLLGGAVVGIGASVIVASVTYLSRRGVLSRLRDWLASARGNA